MGLKIIPGEVDKLLAGMVETIKKGILLVDEKAEQQHINKIGGLTDVEVARVVTRIVANNLIGWKRNGDVDVAISHLLTMERFI